MSAVLDIVAVGARTPVGLRAETSAAAVRAGVSRLREVAFVSPRGEPLVLGLDSRLDPNLHGHARMLAMLESVIGEVRGKLGTIDLSSGGCEVLLTLPETRPGFSEQSAGWLAHETSKILTTQGMSARVAVRACGHAGGCACVEEITAVAPRGRPSLYMVLGVDSYLGTATLAWLEQRRQLAQPAIRSGFTPGEAAACLVLATPSARQHLRLPCLARVVGVATAREHCLPDSETGSFGEGLSEAVLRAAARLSLPADAADAVYCDINGERYRAEEWGFFAMRGYQAVRSLAYETPCPAWGDVGAASGVPGAILAVQSFIRGYAPGPRALVMAGSPGGLRGAMFLQAPRT